jgi:hypothetical protein
MEYCLHCIYLLIEKALPELYLIPSFGNPVDMNTIFTQSLKPVAKLFEPAAGVILDKLFNPSTAGYIG